MASPECGSDNEVQEMRFGARELEYLGHLLTADGVKPISRLLDSVRSFPPPQDERQVQSFVHLAGYYRRFIADFASKAAPLTVLTRKTEYQICLVPHKWFAAHRAETVGNPPCATAGTNQAGLPQGDTPPPRKSPAPRAATTAHPIPSEPVRPVFTTVLSSAATTWFPIQHWANKPAVPYTSHAVATSVPPQQAFTRTKGKSIRFTIRHWVPPREYTTAPCAPEPSSLQARHSHRRYTAHTQLP
ncbi:hypothetical protein H257_03304 [Aphanomyces astaci]|uniref:Reverse transcriptase/retrotransposon-derived protein RNase H-like domain-containing protein n=1 Tax=Aphanomyces astaci TaxID=112090 RepID=W4H382_APHAT|nr:hypothetical protein H257_03304 [Aphanomyces astaci]ETV85598.1 hypothetical protein H257_03304 [Aphanomyces astaci]|eukprot:XP_009825616.1 hypothetical protein H257_03304 [Aphanomyces astaci]